MLRALGLGLVMTCLTGCVGAWGPDVPRPVVVSPPPPVIVIEPVVPYYYSPYYCYGCWYGYWGGHWGYHRGGGHRYR